MNKEVSNQEMQEQLAGLQKARSKAEELTKEKSRIAGEIGALEKQLLEIETKCKTDFGCDVLGLPVLITELREESEAEIVEAEIILGLREKPIEIPEKTVVSNEAKQDNAESAGSKKACPVDEDGMF